jgi:hypothetical protein
MLKTKRQLTAAEILNNAVTEKAFTQQIAGLSRMLGYKYYHPWLSIHSPRGFPDCCLVKGERLIFAELKREKGELSPHQVEWLDLLKATGKAEVYVWRPSQIEDIANILRGI